MSAEKASDNFLAQVRRALQHLYDPGELRRSPLQDVLPLVPNLERVQALRKVLQDAIQALKPEESVPLDSNAWRIYDVLAYRFIEQSSQKEVAADMALSVRQLQRLETAALEVFCDYLVSHFNLRLDSGGLVPSSAGFPEQPGMALEQEYDWLKKNSQREEIALSQLVESALGTLEPLIQAEQAQVRVVLPPSLPEVFGQATILRQVLINLLTAALRIGKNGRVSLAASARLGKMHIQITSQPAAYAGTYAEKPEVEEILRVAHELAELSGGALSLQPLSGESKPFEARFVLPTVKRSTILAIDDNNDALLLLERYLSGSHYQFVGGRDPAQLFELVEAYLPDLILLDVMLPGIDGWDLLARLKRNPATNQIPVIISTILPQESLALMLGAAAFLRKPFTQAQLLATLEQQAGPPTPGPN